MTKEKLNTKDEEFLASLNKDIVFNHKAKGTDGYMDTIGVRERDIKKFIVDLMEDAGDKISQAIEYIWKSDNSIEFKICCLFWFGRHIGNAESGHSDGMDNMLKKAVQVSGSEIKEILKLIERHRKDED